MGILFFYQRYKIKELDNVGSSEAPKKTEAPKEVKKEAPKEAPKEEPKVEE